MFPHENTQFIKRFKFTLEIKKDCVKDGVKPFCLHIRGIQIHNMNDYICHNVRNRMKKTPIAPAILCSIISEQ